jgi:hypothetical protein
MRLRLIKAKNQQEELWFLTNFLLDPACAGMKNGVFSLIKAILLLNGL